MTNPDYHIETVNGCTFRLRSLPGGVFEMGSEERISFWKTSPIHPVRLSPFHIGEFLVTQALWKAVLGLENNPSAFQSDRRPVEQVSWLDIVEGDQDRPAFLDRLNDLTQSNRLEGHFYRLPTEAEWEYAARAGTPCTYAGSDKLKEVGWYDLNSHSMTQEGGRKRPNDFGLYDMSGNMLEWCWDWVSDSYYQECLGAGIKENPTGPYQGHFRVLRGGAWIDTPSFCRVSSRHGAHPSHRNHASGFRLVLAPPFTERAG